jgi:hypothetical protein
MPTAASRTEPRTPTESGIGMWRSMGERMALWVFVAGELFCFVFYVWIGHGRWFLADEWDFLAVRTTGNLHELFISHSQHWSTLPILAYRLLWEIVGIRTYLPYLIFVVALHLAVAALLRQVMRRSGVSPWLSTLAALIFALFGSGYFDIIYGFQIGFCGSLVFGLVYLLLADHDGPSNRRDFIGLLAGLASLMCSGVGVTMVAAVVIAVVIRRGWRAALLPLVSMGAAYLLWFALIGHEGYPPAAGADQILRFVGRILLRTFVGIGTYKPLGIILIGITIVGVALAWNQSSAGGHPRRHAAPTGLLAGALVFSVITGAGRGSTSVTSVNAQSRYSHILAALLLPILAVAADAIIQRWRYATPIILVALVVGIPGNVQVVVQKAHQYDTIANNYRPFILSLPTLPGARVVPASTEPDPYYDPWITMGWLLAGVRSGRIPPPPPTVTARQRADWTLGLTFRSVSQPVHGSTCQTVGLPSTRLMQKGQTLIFRGGINVNYMAAHHVKSAPQLFLSLSGDSTYETYIPMRLQFTPANGQLRAQLCTPPRLGS